MRALSRHFVEVIIDRRNGKVTRDALVTTCHDTVTTAVGSGQSIDGAASRPEYSPLTDHESHLVMTEPVVIGSEMLTLANAIAAGQVSPTVTDIRPYPRCSQAKAAQLRRTAIATLDPTATASCSLQIRPRLVHVAPLARVA